jgi:hypothetical protein
MLGTVVALGFRLAAMRLARSFLALAAQTVAQVLGLVMPWSPLRLWQIATSFHKVPRYAVA